MGIFGKKKKSAKDNTGYYHKDVENANENLPVAVAVFPDAEPLPAPMTVYQPTAPPASKQQQQGGVLTLPAAPPRQQQQQQQQQLVQQRQNQSQHLVISREPMPLTPCWICGKNTRTRVTTFPDYITWCLVGLTLFLFWPLFWVPLVMNSTRKSVHYCNNCNTEIGVIHSCQDCCVKHR